LDQFFTTHAGHGLGLMHPEPPFFVPDSTEVLQPGDIVTLEPGLYTDDMGMRFEHIYHITENGCQRLSEHLLSLACNG
jgi:Xaa-Pro aminopeptidase